MFSKNFVLISIVPLMVLLQATCGNSDLVNCIPFNKKGLVTSAFDLVDSRTIHCPPPNIIRDDVRAFCCNHEDTDLPYCCDAEEYAKQNAGVALGLICGGIILMMVCICACCYCCCSKRQHIIMPTVVYPAWLTRRQRRNTTELQEEA